MNLPLSRASRRVLWLASALGVIALGAADAQQAPAGGGLVNPPGVSISREPLNTNPDTWVGCHHITNGPENVYGLRSGMLCAPSIQTGDPATQAKLRAERDAYLAANPQAGGRGGRGGRGAAQPAPPMVCNPALTPASAAGGRGGMTQGGRGKIRVLVVIKGHPYEHELFDNFLDCMGNDITWAKADHPAADLLMNPAAGKNFDVYLFYDLGGPGQVIPDGSGDRFYPDPTPQLKKGFEALLKAGKGMVFIHHAAAAWPHVWPEYSEVIGGACDWYAPVTVRGILDPHHGFYGNTEQDITVVDKNSPITQGLGDGFHVRDEAYACAWFPESVHPLLTTSFAPPDPLVNLNPKRPFSNLSAWYKASENSPVFYVQIGHDHQAWENPSYQLLIDNAIKWAASPEALAWARKNHTTIFHDKAAAKAPAKKKA